MDSKETVEKYKQSLFKQERYEVIQEGWEEFMKTIGVNEFQYGYAMFCSGSKSAWLYQQREIDALEARISLLETKNDELINENSNLKRELNYPLDEIIDEYTQTRSSNGW